MAGMSPELASAIIASARRLGVDPVDIGTAISYETGGKFDPNLWGGKNNNHLGYIQFGAPEREKYGVREGMTPTEQMGAVENFLRDRGVKPGMGMLDIYSTINAGSPGRYNASDAANGGAPGTVADKVRDQMAGHRANVTSMLSGDAPVGALAGPSISAGAGVNSVGVASGPVASDAPVTGAGPASATAAAPPSMPAAFGMVGAGLENLGGKLRSKEADFLDPQQIQMARPNIGQSQQIAAALADAYGLTQPQNPAASVFPSPWNRSGKMGM